MLLVGWGVDPTSLEIFGTSLGFNFEVFTWKISPRGVGEHPRRRVIFAPCDLPKPTRAVSKTMGWNPEILLMLTQQKSASNVLEGLQI